MPAGLTWESVNWTRITPGVPVRDKFRKFKFKTVTLFEVSAMASDAPSLILAVPAEKSKMVGFFSVSATAIKSEPALVPGEGELMDWELRKI